MRARPGPPPSSRLASIAALVPLGARVADVGSGHGRLALHLLAEGRARWCVATERDASPLEEIARSAGPLWGKLELRLGDGLEPLRPEDRLDVAVLAGMGARSIRRILSSPKRDNLGIGRFVLAPQAEAPSLRRWLLGNGLRIVREVLVEERGRLYVVIAAEPGEPAGLLDHPSLTPEEVLEAGPRLLGSPCPSLLRYWQRQESRLSAILERLPHGRRPARLASALARASRIRVHVESALKVQEAFCRPGAAR